MILEQITNNVTKNVESTSFSIKANAHAFSVLSDKLYSNKIAAIIRELSTNAYDAHVAANNADPIEITLPNIFDLHFIVKDNGVGLSEDQVIGHKEGDVYYPGIFNTYFESTKQESNEYIGALGLGSKSPFCYVNSFIVESRYNKKKTVYSCFKDVNGFPSVAKLSSINTEERDGLTVIVSVNPDDIDEFVNRVKQYFNEV